MSTAELLSKQEYKYGFVTDIESDMIPRGLTEDTIRLIVEKKNEPEWMLEFRLKAYPALADDGAEALAQPHIRRLITRTSSITAPEAESDEGESRRSRS